MRVPTSKRDRMEADEESVLSSRQEIIKRKAKRYFGKQTDKILGMIEQDDADGAVILIQKALLSSVISVLDQAENNVIASGGAKGIYAFNTLISQVRELIGDIQASQDTALIAKSIADLYNNLLRGVAQSVIDQHHMLKRDLEPYLDKKDRKSVLSKVDETTRGIAQYLSHVSSEGREKVYERLVE